MTLEADGALLLPGGASASLPALDAVLRDLPSGRPGIRIGRHPAASAMLCATGPIGRHAADVLGPACRPVRAILFDKQVGMNWSLGWHQDRTIHVRARREVPGFGPWTVKHGQLHVAPPVALLTRMLTMRVHLDRTDADNAPLLIVPGSHRHGRIAESAVDAIVAAGPVTACLAEAGDVWLYATLILHASQAARSPLSRRVLQVDYSADPLPGGLEWAGL